MKIKANNIDYEQMYFDLLYKYKQLQSELLYIKQELQLLNKQDKKMLNIRKMLIDQIREYKNNK